MNRHHRDQPARRGSRPMIFPGIMKGEFQISLDVVFRSGLGKEEQPLRPSSSRTTSRRSTQRTWRFCG